VATATSTPQAPTLIASKPSGKRQADAALAVAKTARVAAWPMPNKEVAQHVTRQYRTPRQEDAPFTHR
jgi:hypothetical protein